MKAAVVSGHGQAPAYIDFADPEASDSEEVLTVTAAAISPVTRSRAAGSHYSSAANFPLIPGVDGVGRRSDGQRVFFFMPRAPFGSLGERTVVRAGSAIPLPDGLDDAMAAAVANPGVSSWAALRERTSFRSGQTVLVNGATGASGRLAVQVAKHLGAGKVIATGRNPQMLQALSSLGADLVVPVDLESEELEQRLGDVFAQGVDVVLDYLWGDVSRSVLVAAARRGKEGVPIRFVSIGSVVGQDLALPSAVLRSSLIELVGSGLGGVPVSRLTESISQVLQAAAAGHLSLAIRRAPLADVTALWTSPESGGRAVLLPGAAT